MLYFFSVFRFLAVCMFDCFCMHSGASMLLFALLFAFLGEWNTEHGDHTSCETKTNKPIVIKQYWLNRMIENEREKERKERMGSKIVISYHGGKHSWCVVDDLKCCWRLTRWRLTRWRLTWWNNKQTESCKQRKIR